MKEKMRQLLGKLKNGGSRKQKVAGAGCVAAAAVCFALIGQINSRAEMVKIDGLAQKYEKESEGVYLVETAAQILELRDVKDSSVTTGKTFKLKKDIEVSLAAQGVADGIFYGTFDGNGYAITFTDVELTSNAAGTSTDANEGVLFGTLASGAEVKNLFVELPSDASYTRTVDRGSTVEAEGGWEKNEVTLEEPVLTLNETINEWEASTEYTTIDGFETAYVNKNDASDIISATQYTSLGNLAKRNYDVWGRVKTVSGIDTQIKDYTANAAGDDSFGIVCGLNNGTVSQVGLQGSIAVYQRTQASTSQTKEERTQTKTYYYKAGTESVQVTEESSALQTGSTGSTKLFVLVPGAAQSAEGSSTDGKFKVSQQTEQTYYRAGDTIEYTVTLTNETGKELTDLSITPTKTGGTWTDENGSTLASTTAGKLSGLTMSAGTARTLYYRVTSSSSIPQNINNSFTVSASAENETSATGLSSTVQITVQEEGAPEKTKNFTEQPTNYLKLSGSATGTFTAGSKVTYTVTVENTGSNAMRNVQVNLDGATWTPTSDISISGSTATISSLAAGEEKTLTCSYTILATELSGSSISNTFSVSCTLVSVLGYSVETGNTAVQTKSTVGTETTSGEVTIKDQAGTEVLYLSQEVEEGNDGIIYTVTLQNLHADAKLSGVKLAMSQTGSWYTNKECTTGTTAPGDGLTIDKNATVTYYFKAAKPTTGGMNTVTNILRVAAGQRDSYQALQSKKAYTFTGEKSNAGDWAKVSEKTENYAASNLYIGAAAGTNAGTVTELWQAASLTATGAEQVTNGASLAAGQLTGRQTTVSGVLSGNHLEGSVQAVQGSGTGAAETVAGQVLGLAEQNVTIQNSVIKENGELAGRTAASVTVTSENCLQGADATVEKVAQNSGTLTAFRVFTVPAGTDSSQDQQEFALNWLCKDSTFDYSVGTGGTITTSAKVTEGSDSRDYTALTGLSLRYQSTDDATEAQNQEADEWKLYQGALASFTVGDSGYLTVQKAYATDGRYHFLWETTGGEGPAPHYLYAVSQGTAPVYTAQAETADGKDLLKASYNLSGIGITSGSGTNKLYYTYLSSTDKTYHNGSEEAQFASGKLQASLTFQEQNLTLNKVCWQVDGKFYPYVVSKDTSYIGTPLTAPGLQTSRYYKDAAGALQPVWENVNAGGSCTVQAEQMFQADTTGAIEGSSCAYYFEDNSLSEKSVGTVETLVTDCDEQGRFRAPESAGTYRLYLMIQKAGYESQMHLYTVTVVAKETAAITLWTAGDKELNANAPITTGDQFKFVLPGNLGLANSSIRYLVSSTRLTDVETLYGMVNAQTVASGGTETVSRGSSQTELYLYVQLCGTYSGQTACTEVQEYHYEFLNRMQQPGITPNATSVPKETTLESGTQITLSASGGSSIYYISAAAQSSESAPVVELVTDGDILRRLENEGTTESLEGSNVKYVKSNNRWYEIKHTDNRNVQKYNSTERFTIANTVKNPVDWYVYAVAFCEGYEPSPVATYVYYLSALEQVEKPEADLPDMDAGGNRTEVTKGSSLTFGSRTLGATLYYSLNNNPVEPLNVGDGKTFRYNSATGIPVDGNYGDTFQINIMACKAGMEDSDVSQFIYVIAPQETAAAPTATPETSTGSPTVVIPGEKIVLSTVTRGASIYYTTDGTNPEVVLGENGFVAQGTTKLYNAREAITMPSEGTGYFTVKAIAVKEDLANSKIVQLTYQFPGKVLSPYATVASGAVDLNTQVSLKSGTSGAVIYYTIAYGEQTPEDPTVLSAVFDGAQPFVITQKTTVKAMAVKDNVKSNVVTFTYTALDKVADSTPTVGSGAVVVRGTTVTLSAPDGATVYYTLDGSDPSDSSNTAVMTGRQVTLDGDLGSVITVRTYTRASGKSPSDVSTYTYQISKYPGGVGCDTENGTELSNGSTVNLITDVTGATIYYTTNGSAPGTGSSKGTTVQLNGTPGNTITVKAVAVVSGSSTNSTASFNFKLRQKPSAPTASPSGGALSVATRVTLTSAGGKIYYTTDGSEPSEASALYTEPILINRATTLKAVVVSDTGERSDVATFSYTTSARALAPTADVESGTVEPGTVVTFTTATGGAYIYYSMDGTVPTMDNLTSLMVVPGNQITINRSVQIKAVAFMDGMQLSPVATYTYEVSEIPAVTEKEAREALLQAEQLKDSDATGLARRTDAEEAEQGGRTLREGEYATQVKADTQAVPLQTQLVTVEKEKDSRAQESVKSILGEEYAILCSYDMKLLLDGRSIQPSSPVEIGIPIPEEYLDAAVQIVYVKEDGTIRLLETRRENGMAYAMTDHFSNYVLVGVEREEERQLGVDYLLLLEITAGVFLLVGIVYFLIKKIPKWKQKRREKSGKKE